MRSFLASVNLFVDSTQTESVMAALAKISGVERIYQVAGEYDIITLVRTSTVEEFRDILQKQIAKINGVKSIITSIILKPHKGPESQKKYN